MARPETQGVSRRRSLAGDALVWTMPITGAVAYLAAFAATLPTLLAAVYASADTAMAPYLTQEWMRAPADSVMVMGHVPFYPGYWILRFLHLFGGYRTSWELAPWLVSAGASLAVGWAASRAAGRMAGALVTATLICAGSSLLELQFSWSVHALAYANVMLLGAFAVWLSPQPGGPRPIRLWLIVLVLTPMTATGIATDKIVLLAGLVPFVITGALSTWLAERDTAVPMGSVVVALGGGSVVGALLIQAAMRGDGITATHFPVALTPLSEIPSHLKLLTQSVFTLLSGDINQSGANPTGPLGYLCAVAVAYLLIVAAIGTTHCVRRLKSAIETRAEPGTGLVLGARFAQTTYWGTSAGLLSLAYLFTTVGVDIFTLRYLVTVAYAVVILGITRGVTHGRWWRVATAGAATILIITGAVALLHHDLQRSERAAPTVAMADAVKHLAVKERAAVVYAGYWDAYPLGWLVPGAVPVYPVMRCGAGLCGWTANPVAGSGINTWYVPRRGSRSLLLLDSKLDASVYLPPRPPRSLGAPAARFGLDHGRLRAYLYDYDIAARFTAGLR